MPSLNSNNQKNAERAVWRDTSIAALLGVNVNLFNLKLGTRIDGTVESIELLPLFEGNDYWLPCLDKEFNIHSFRQSIDKSLLEGKTVPVSHELSEQLREMQRVLLRRYFKPQKPADEHLDFMIEYNYGLVSLNGIKEKIRNALAS